MNVRFVTRKVNDSLGNITVNVSHADEVCGPSSVPEGQIRGLHREAQKEYTRQRLLMAGSEVFRRSGFAAATIEEISDQAGVGRTTFYTHFKSKNELAAAITISSTGKNLELICDLGRIDLLDSAAYSQWLNDLEFLTTQVAKDAPLIELPSVTANFSAIMHDVAKRIAGLLEQNGWMPKIEHATQHIELLVLLVSRWVYRHHVQNLEIPIGSRDARLSILQNGLRFAFSQSEPTNTRIGV